MSNITRPDSVEALQGKHIHMIGVLGVSMAPLAELLQRRYGAIVSGSDQSLAGHAAENVHGADYVIRTAAAHDDNIEVEEARRLGIPVLERAEVWGLIMRKYPNTICVAGTHGKSTTTAMLASIFIEAGRDPSVMVGATLPLIGGNHRAGSGADFIAEADEYSNSFRFFKPHIAVILNMEYDHPDFFPSYADYKAKFRAFADSADIVVTRRSVADELGLDAVIIDDSAEFALKVPGEHNRLNAAAAASAAKLCGIPHAAVQRALESYTGVKRRFEYKGTLNSASFYDDYAHHPSELTATLTAAKALPHKRVIAAFQPHTYTRTKALLSDFADALTLADVALLTDIYAAREDDIYGISSRDLSALVKNSVYCPTLQELSSKLKATAQPGDIVLSIGAGDITNVWNFLQ